jgi:hypothetical protein
LVTFFAPQESILRNWCQQFPPDSIDKKRNNDIFSYQKNRNPFIDHPEFLERIYSLAYNSVAPVKKLIYCDTNPISKNYFLYDSLNYRIVLFNTGNNFNINYTSDTIHQDAILEIKLSKKILNTLPLNDTLIIENNSLDHPLIKIPITILVSSLHINASKNVLANNDSATLTVNSNGLVSWGTGATGPSLTVKNAGVYFASITDSSGCHHTDSVNITKSGVGINPISHRGFLVYPNPAQNSVNISNSGNDKVNFRLMNSLGEILCIKSARPNEIFNLDLSLYTNGIYYLINDSGEGTELIINK